MSSESAAILSLLLKEEENSLTGHSQSIHQAELESNTKPKMTQAQFISARLSEGFGGKRRMTTTNVTQNTATQPMGTPSLPRDQAPGRKLERPEVMLLDHLKGLVQWGLRVIVT